MTIRIPRRSQDERISRPPASRHEREIECAQGGIAALIRVSSHWDAEKSKGSVEFQRSQFRHVKRWGVDPESVRVFEFLGHSAKRTDPRAYLTDIVEEIRRGQIRMVILGWTSRLGRGWDDKLDALFSALKDARGAIVAQGRFYDLLDYEDAHRLREQITAAERENEERARLASLGRYELAKKHELLVPLPTGLVWADPKDPVFRAAMEAHDDLKTYLLPETLAQHRTHVARDGTSLYVFPDPREECWRATRFLLGAVRQTQSIAGALDAVLAADVIDYPRPGYLPQIRGSIFRPKKLKWIPIRGRPDGRDDQAFGRVRDWVFSPALYGIYSYVPQSLLPIAHILPDPVEDVWVVDAFPGLLPVEEYELTTRAARNPARRNLRASGPASPRLNLISRLSCSHPLPNGEPCGLTFTVTFPTSSTLHRYVSTACGKRGHAANFPASIDDTIANILVESFTKAQAETEFRIAMDAGYEADVEFRRAEAALNEARSERDYAKRQAREASVRGDLAAEADWLQDHRAALATAAEMERKISGLEYSRDQVHQICQRERETILRLANDFPDLLSAARRHENLGRELSEPLISRVRVRRLGTGIHWVQVEFPGGAIVGRIHVATNKVPSTAFMRAWAYQRLTDWLNPATRRVAEDDRRIVAAAAEIASRWNALIGPRPGGAKWDSDDVLSAAYQFDRNRDTAHGSGQSIEELAVEWNRAPDAVETAALQGHLGVPSLKANGALRLAPNEAQIRVAFPDVLVRRGRGDLNDSLVRVGEYAARNGLNPRRLLASAHERGATVTDAAGSVWIPEATAAEVATPDMAVSEGRAEGWYRFRESQVILPGVTRKPLERVTISAWPDRGPELRGVRWFWIDAEVEEELREHTLDDVLEALGLTERIHEMRTRSALKQQALAQAGLEISDTMIEYAGKQGRITVCTAAYQKYGSPSRWVLVPQVVWNSTDPDVIRAWLRGT
jgi:hypothetical protein